MYEILLAVDEKDEHAEAQVDAVLDLPGQDEIHAHVFHDFQDNPTGASIGQLASARHAKDSLEDAGIEVTLHETSGDPSEAILDTARDLDVDSICVASRKRTPTGKVLFGSVTQAVILGADRPVIVCGAES
ncbi:universal stress protein [Salarchaeum japonicum]|uniref:universal stress protein n=1 Tax=Salarchaeum japonicum TaxID=555573 RepID=UPI003C7278D8